MCSRVPYNLFMCFLGGGHSVWLGGVKGVFLLFFCRLASRRWSFLGLLGAACLLSLGLCLEAEAQTPARMHFGDLKLRITPSARREIDAKIRSLSASRRSLSIKIARAQKYFPLIEEALRVEGVPERLKYLAIQESALISDAVSSANAVGFWQFKDFTAKEVGIRLDRRVDGRKHLIASTRGAARYMKRNNFYFDNWIYALTAYYAGAGGARSHVEERYFGKKNMTISSKTHWYVKTFLAHVLVFEREMAHARPDAEAVQLLAYYGAKGSSLSRVARKFSVSYDLLKKHNKWLRGKRVPSDESLPVMVPLSGRRAKRLIAKHHHPMVPPKGSTRPNTLVASQPTLHLDEETEATNKKVFVRLTKQLSPRVMHWVRINGMYAVIAHRRDNLNTLALKAGISKERLVRNNEIPEGHQIRAGQIYYLRLKRFRSRFYYHIAKEGESLWDISQRYGIRLRSLRRLNRMSKDEELKPGRELRLRRRLKGEPVYYHQEKGKKILSPPTPLVNHMGHPKGATPTAASRNNRDKTLAEEQTASAGKNTEGRSLYFHAVQQGESLYSVAKRYGLSVMQLAEWNQLEITEVLYPGEKLQFYTNKEIDETRSLSSKAYDAAATMKEHVVMGGETAYAIAKRYGIALSELLTANAMSADEILRPGQRLRVKQKGKVGKSSSQTRSLKTHTVKRGETLYAIAKQYAISVYALKEWNNRKDNALKVGEVLRLQP